MAKRIDGTPNTEVDDRVLDIHAVRYQLRFDPELFAVAGKLMVRDFDGDFDVMGAPEILGGRNRYMHIKAVKRG